MGESPDKSSYKEVIACVVCVSIILVSFQVVNLMNQQTPQSDLEISHTLTVWITPGDEEFHLHLEFYGSEQDAHSETNRFVATAIGVQPLSAEEKQIALISIPEDLFIVWVKIYFNQETEEPNVILNLELGIKATTDLQGHEIGLLLEQGIVA
ncbi:MAG: hypothetical protein ACTSSE_01740 [Candidatus Thorarchaeota archaeon]